MREGAKAINTHLKDKSWLVGDELTLADIVVFNCLITPFIFAFDAGFCKAMGNLTTWFEKMAKLPFVARNAGYVKVPGKTQ